MVFDHLVGWRTYRIDSALIIEARGYVAPPFPGPLRRAGLCRRPPAGGPPFATGQPERGLIWGAYASRVSVRASRPNLRQTICVAERFIGVTPIDARQRRARC